MLIAVLLFVLHRWAVNQPAVTLPIVLSGIFAIFVIAVLDGGKTEPVARGFAWLFLIAAAYKAIPAFSGALRSAQNAASKQTSGRIPPANIA